MPRFAMFAGAVLLGIFIGQAQLGPASAEAATPPRAPAVIRAQRFELVNAKGETAGRWSTEKDGSPTLELLDHTGGPRVGLSVRWGPGDGMAIVCVTDKRRVPVAGLMSDGSTHAVTVQVGDDETKPMAQVGMVMENDGAGRIFTRGKDGELIWKAEN